MISMRKLACGAALTVLASAASTAVYAQATTGAIRGQIVGAIPEPMTLTLMAAGLIAAGGMARRRITRP